MTRTALLTLLLTLTGCAFTTTQKADLAASSAELACSLPVVGLVGCGVALGLRGASTWLNAPETQTFERKASTPTSGGTQDEPSAPSNSSE